MKQLICLLTIIYFSFDFIGVQAQSASEEVSDANFNASLIEQLVVKKLNQHRYQLGLDPMVAQAKLTEAAKIQSEACLKSGQLGYEHPNACLRYASDRIASVGGSHSEVKEFLNSFQFGANYQVEVGQPPVPVQTYEQVADFLVNQWLTTDWQLKALESPYLQHFGLGTSRKSGDSEMFFDGLFAMPPFVFPTSFQTPADMYGLKKCNSGGACAATANCCQKREIFQSQQQKGNVPLEVGYGVYVDGKDLIFRFSDKSYFKMLFAGAKDGVAVDVVHKSQFTKCGWPEQTTHWAYRGLLLKPVFTDALRNGDMGLNVLEINTKIGEVPAGLNIDDLEFNLVYISDGNICQYNTYSNVKLERWQLLESGLFLDSLREGLEYLTEERLVRQELSYVVPFKQGVTSFDAKSMAGVKGLLKEGGFELDSIIIHGYASVEGSEQANLELAQKRADNIYNAIKDALQSNPKKSVMVEENWAEFYRDVLQTPYKSFVGLSKAQVKDSLKAGAAKSLEPYLEQHRKGIIKLIIKKVDRTLFGKSPDELKVLFGQAIEEEDAKRAQEIMQVIFSKNQASALPEDFIDGLNIPQSIAYGNLLNSRIAYQQLYDSQRLLISLREFKELEQILPDNPKVKYNLVVTRLKLWLASEAFKKSYLDVGHEELKQHIMDLKGMGISQDLVNRLRINYHIIECEKFTAEKAYEKKNTALNNIISLYQGKGLSNKNLVQLAKFYASYTRMDESLKVLMPEVMRFNPDHEVMFYFLNLTIYKDEMIEDSRYKSILVNAYQQDKARLKTFFKNDREGVSFQILDNAKLKAFYCDFLML